MKLDYIKTTALAVLFAGATVPASATAQDSLGGATDRLRAYFANKELLVKIDMPANEDGVDIRTWEPIPFNFNENLERTNRFGISIHEGDRVRVTDIVRKGKHIEFHLDGGGWTRSQNPRPSTPSYEELTLQNQLAGATSEERVEIQAQLDELRRQREENDRRAAEQYQQNILNWGSRFNIRYEHDLTLRELTPESVMDALREYVDFDPDGSRNEPTSGVVSNEPTPGAVSDYDALREHIVKITSATDSGPDIGSGIVVGIDGTLVLIATAFHVVEDATSVQVLFYDRQYAAFDGAVFQRFDAALDIAIVVVDTSTGADIGDRPTLATIGDASLRENVDVVGIGHPQDLDWQIARNVIARLNDGSDNRKLRFSRTGILGGYSGGGLFLESGELVGMITHTDAQHGIAVKMDALKSVLANWNIPMNRLQN